MSEIRRLHRLMRAKEVAEELQCSLAHVYALGRSGDLPTARVGVSRRVVRFSTFHVIEMQRGCRLQTAAAAAEMIDQPEDFLGRHLLALDAVEIDGEVWIPNSAIDLHAQRVKTILALPEAVA